MTKVKSVSTIKDKGGRPEHAPTTEKRLLVSVMRAIGHNLEDIAGSMQIAPRTLSKHYSHEIEQGKITLNSRVMAAMYVKAIQGDFPAQKFIAMCNGMNPNEVPTTTINITPQRIEAPILEGECIDLNAVINQ